MNNKRIQRGILYIASGEKYINMAAKSARSAKEQMPEIGITIITDTPNMAPEIFDSIEPLDENDRAGLAPIKPKYSPYDRTLYLDADTYVSEPVYELFDILDNHDMAFAHSPGRLPVPGLPDPWIEFQNGVIAYKNCSGTNRFLKRWQRVYDKMVEQGVTDRQQPTFAMAVAQSDLDYFVLPREYNVRVPRFGYLARNAKIVHGGGQMTVPVEDLAETLNRTDGRRIHWYYNQWNLKRNIKVLFEEDRLYSVKNILYMFIRSMKRSGFCHALTHSYLEMKKILQKGRSND